MNLLLIFYLGFSTQLIRNQLYALTNPSYVQNQILLYYILIEKMQCIFGADTLKVKGL